MDQSSFRWGGARRRWSVWTSEIDFVEGVADNRAAVLGIAVHELLVELVNPCQEILLRFRNRIENSIFESGHGRLAPGGTGEDGQPGNDRAPAAAGAGASRPRAHVTDGRRLPGGNRRGP